MSTKFRHDLGDRAVVGSVSRLGDEGGPVIAVWFEDAEKDVRVGIRIRTIEQAKALADAAYRALRTLEDEIGSAPVIDPSYFSGVPGCGPTGHAEICSCTPAELEQRAFEAGKAAYGQPSWVG